MSRVNGNVNQRADDISMQSLPTAGCSVTVTHSCLLACLDFTIQNNIFFMVAFLTVHKMKKRQPAKKATGAFMAVALTPPKPKLMQILINIIFLKRKN